MGAESDKGTEVGSVGRVTNTPDSHATPGDGTSHVEGTSQPVAWAVLLAAGLLERTK